MYESELTKSVKDFSITIESSNNFLNNSAALYDKNINIPTSKIIFDNNEYEYYINNITTGYET